MSLPSVYTQDKVDPVDGSERDIEERPQILSVHMPVDELMGRLFF